MRNKCEANHVLYRDGVYYYVRRVPYDLTFHYDVKRLCFSLKTKSASAAVRASKSINQRLEDYWLGLRLQKISNRHVSDDRYVSWSWHSIRNLRLHTKIAISKVRLSIQQQC